MDKRELGNLILASEDTMYRVAKTLLHEDADCADAIQEAIVKAFTKIDTLREPAYAKTWLIRILMNECYALMRKNRHTISLEEQEWNPPTSEEAHDYSDLYEAISSLPKDTAITVTLYYLEGYSIREVAELLDSNESTIKSRLSRARKKLRSVLGEGGI